MDILRGVFVLLAFLTVAFCYNPYDCDRKPAFRDWQEEEIDNPITTTFTQNTMNNGQEMIQVTIASSQISLDSLIIQALSDSGEHLGKFLSTATSYVPEDYDVGIDSNVCSSDGDTLLIQAEDGPEGINSVTIVWLSKVYRSQEIIYLNATAMAVDERFWTLSIGPFKIPEARQMNASMSHNATFVEEVQNNPESSETTEDRMTSAERMREEARREAEERRRELLERRREMLEQRERERLEAERRNNQEAITVPTSESDESESSESSEIEDSEEETNPPFGTDSESDEEESSSVLDRIDEILNGDSSDLKDDLDGLTDQDDPHQIILETRMSIAAKELKKRLFDEEPEVDELGDMAEVEREEERHREEIHREKMDYLERKEREQLAREERRRAELLDEAQYYAQIKLEINLDDKDDSGETSDQNEEDNNKTGNANQLYISLYSLVTILCTFLFL